MYNLEVAHKDLTGYKVFVDGELKDEGSCTGSVSVNVHPSNSKIEFWIEPWGIKPLVRVNNILVDYSLAQIDLYDHKFDIVLSSTFFNDYQNLDTKYRIQEVFGNKDPDPNIYDAIIGVGKKHQDLIDAIRREIDE